MSQEELDAFAAKLVGAFDGQVEAGSGEPMPAGATASRRLAFPSLGARAALYAYESWDDAQREALAIRSSAAEHERVEVATNGSTLLVVRADPVASGTLHPILGLISLFSGKE